MRLPNADQAKIDIAKLRDYSLNPVHPEGKHKARVFAAATGLGTGDAQQLCDMILEAVLPTTQLRGDQMNTERDIR